MAKRKRAREQSRFRLTVTALVAAVVVLCVLSSWEDKNGYGLLPSVRLPQLTFVRDLVDDIDLRFGGGAEPAAAVVTVESALPDARLEVHIQDMGQADSILIKGPSANVLIDAGENNQGEEVLRYLRAQGVRKLDYVIGTHPHSDHIGGLDTVILGMSVDTVILPEIPADMVPTTQTYTDLLEAIAKRNLRITTATPGRTYDLGDGATLRILGPLGEYSDLNNFSVVSRLTYGETSFLFTGDMCAGAENDLLSSGATLRADVLDVGHHGSDTSTSPDFLRAVSPRIATISVGLDNSYGHPHRDVMERLEAGGIRILRTDLNGVVVISSDGERLAYSTQR